MHIFVYMYTYIVQLASIQMCGEQYLVQIDVLICWFMENFIIVYME